MEAIDEHPKYNQCLVASIAKSGVGWVLQSTIWTQGGKSSLLYVHNLAFGRKGGELPAMEQPQSW
jgi:hypothetical protein